MNKLRDIIYDKSDLFIALIILVLAGFVIYQRIDVIMDYPEMLAAKASAAEVPAVEQIDSRNEDGDQNTDGEPGENETAGTGEDDSQTGGEATEPGNGGQSSNSSSNVADQTTGEPRVSQVSIYIEYGATGSQIAQLLVDAGLLESREEFYSAVTAAGAETRLQAGNFKIPSDATPAEIISIITN